MTEDVFVSYQPEDEPVRRDKAKILSEKEFGLILKPFSSPFLSLCRHKNLANEQQGTDYMGFLANAIKFSSDAEYLLDRYGALHNQNWIYFRELTATVKNFGKSAFLMEEIKKNTALKTVFNEEEDAFSDFSNKITDFFGRIIFSSFSELMEEGKRLELPIPRKRPLSSYKVRIFGEISLPHTFDQTLIEADEKSVKKLTQRFVDLKDKISALGQVIPGPRGDLLGIVPFKVNEANFRQIGTDVHNLQSWYDTYMANSQLENTYPALLRLRSIFSIMINLSKVATLLSHFFERHLMGKAPLTERMESLVPPTELLEILLRIVLKTMVRLYSQGQKLAVDLLASLVEIVTYEIPVPRDSGFHARPSTRVAKIVEHHGAEVRLLIDGQTFDASSILEMLSAGGYIMTKGLRKVVFKGDKPALDDLQLLAEYNYGETRDGKEAPIPEELNYLVN